MGLLNALAGGLEAVGNSMVKMGLADYQAAIELDRQRALEEFRESAVIRGEKRKLQYADEERTRRSDFVESKAAEIAGKRQVVPESVQDETDAAALALNSSNVSDDVKKQGLLGLSDYANSKAEKAKPTVRDRMEADATYTGDWKNVAAMDDKDLKRELSTALAQGKWENALKIAEMRGDFAMAIGEMKAAAKGGDEKATELMRNITALESAGYSKKEAIAKLLDGKVGESETREVKRQLPDGSEETIRTKLKPGSSAEGKPVTGGRHFVFDPKTGFTPK